MLITSADSGTFSDLQELGRGALKALKALQLGVATVDATGRDLSAVCLRAIKAFRLVFVTVDATVVAGLGIETGLDVDATGEGTVEITIGCTEIELDTGTFGRNSVKNLIVRSVSGSSSQFGNVALGYLARSRAVIPLRRSLVSFLLQFADIPMMQS
jgi:hypothetical protein